MWDESKCNRDDKGRFAEKGSSGYSSEQLDRARQTLNKRVSNYKSRVNLSKAEWRKFYIKIAEVQHGGYASKTKSGKTIVNIEHNNVHSIIIYSGDFIAPQITKVKKVNDNNMHKYAKLIDRLKKEY